MGRFLSRAGFPYERDQKKVITFNSKPVKSTDFDLKGEVCGIQGGAISMPKSQLGTQKININSQEKKIQEGGSENTFKNGWETIEKA